MPLYFDNAATTALRQEALAAMMPYLTDQYANPSSIYAPARAVRRAIDEARQKIATALNAKPEEIYFTSGGTEADNLAIKGITAMNPERKHIITTETEHHGVLFTCKYLEKQDYDITYLPVDSDGTVSPQAVIDAIRDDTALITIMLANNETGTIQPLAEFAHVAKQRGVPVFTDAVQAVGHIAVDVDALGVDMLALSAHKFYGPKGIGALYVRKGTRIAPTIHGGAQEKNRRAGTENVAGIVGMATALELACAEIPAETARLTALTQRLYQGILAKIPHVHLNGSALDKNRLPGNLNISFEFIEGESLLLHLDMKECCASTGSACTSGSLEASHVLLAMGLPHELANAAIRLTLGRNNTDKDVDALIEILAPAVARMRELSPLYDDFLKGVK